MDLFTRREKHCFIPRKRLGKGRKKPGILPRLRLETLFFTAFVEKNTVFSQGLAPGRKHGLKRGLTTTGASSQQLTQRWTDGGYQLESIGKSANEYFST